MDKANSKPTDQITECIQAEGLVTEIPVVTFSVKSAVLTNNERPTISLLVASTRKHLLSTYYVQSQGLWRRSQTHFWHPRSLYWGDEERVSTSIDWLQAWLVSQESIHLSNVGNSDGRSHFSVWPGEGYLSIKTAEWVLGIWVKSELVNAIETGGQSLTELKCWREMLRWEDPGRTHAYCLVLPCQRWGKGYFPGKVFWQWFLSPGWCGLGSLPLHNHADCCLPGLSRIHTTSSTTSRPGSSGILCLYNSPKGSLI